MKSVKRTALGVRYLSIIFFLMIAFSTMIVAVSSEVKAEPINVIWFTETVDNNFGDVSEHISTALSVAVDHNDKVHISYQDFAHLDLKYATNGGGSWVSVTVDSIGNVGDWNHIAIDSNGKVHISYWDETNNAIKYATNAGGSWVNITLASGNDIGFDNSIAIDSLNQVHICYSSSNGFKYITNAGGSWLPPVTICSCYGSSNSIALDSNDTVHISYSNGNLVYVTNAGGSWGSPFTIDSGGDYTSIAIDSNGIAHISYLSGTTEELKYATNAGGTWSKSTIDSGDVGWYNSIAVDPNDKVHISYWDHAHSDLKYATNAGGSWETTTVDSAGDIGYDSSIALDSNGKAHIGYFDATNDDLKHATPAIVPSAPTLTSATPGNTQVVLVWTMPSSNGGSAITNYTVYRSTTSGGETLLTTVGNVLMYTDTGLTNGQTYYYEVSAVNSVGEGPQSNETSATPVTVPTAPQDLQVVTSDSTVDLNWTAPEYIGSGTITYHLFRDGSSIWNGTGLTYTDSGLTNGVNYSYKVAASNSVGWGPNSSSVEATPTASETVPPGVPTNFHITAGNGLVSLSWNPPASNGSAALSGYKLYRGTNSSMMPLLNTTTATTYTDTGLTNGQIYYYKVCAYSSTGNGAMSETLDATPSSGVVGDNTLLYVGIGAIAIVAVAGAAMVVMRRRKS